MSQYLQQLIAKQAHKDTSLGSGELSASGIHFVSSDTDQWPVRDINHAILSGQAPVTGSCENR